MWFDSYPAMQIALIRRCGLERSNTQSGDYNPWLQATSTDDCTVVAL